jgi:hypothetical protein
LPFLFLIAGQADKAYARILSAFFGKLISTGDTEKHFGCDLDAVRNAAG